jgi:hypothetical protein
MAARLSLLPAAISAPSTAYDLCGRRGIRRARRHTWSQKASTPASTSARRTQCRTAYSYLHRASTGTRCRSVTVGVASLNAGYSSIYRFYHAETPNQAMQRMTHCSHCSTVRLTHPRRTDLPRAPFAPRSVCLVRSGDLGRTALPFTSHHFPRAPFPALHSYSLELAAPACIATRSVAARARALLGSQSMFPASLVRLRAAAVSSSDKWAR